MSGDNIHILIAWEYENRYKTTLMMLVYGLKMKVLDSTILINNYRYRLREEHKTVAWAYAFVLSR